METNLGKTTEHNAIYSILFDTIQPAIPRKSNLFPIDNLETKTFNQMRILKIINAIRMSLVNYQFLGMSLPKSRLVSSSNKPISIMVSYM